MARQMFLILQVYSSLQKLTLIRHGESVLNSQRRIQGNFDSSLTPRGKSQTELLSQRIKKRNEPIDFIFSSPLKRAYETADIISNYLGLPVRIINGLKEINLGDWEGKLIDEVRTSEPGLFSDFISKPAECLIPSGENTLDFQKRIVTSIKDILETHKMKNILIVSHAGAISAFLCHLLDSDLNYMWNMNSENSSLTEIIFNNNSSKVTLFNDTYHLKWREMGKSISNIKTTISIKN